MCDSQIFNDVRNTRRAGKSAAVAEYAFWVTDNSNNFIAFASVESII